MEDFNQNLMRMIVAELHLLNGMTCAREMFGKSYFALGVSEKTVVDQAVAALVSSNYQWVTPEQLATKSKSEPVGFRPPT
jgi:hypothetical protein